MRTKLKGVGKCRTDGIIGIVYRKLGGAVTRITICDVMEVITTYIREEVEAGRSVSLGNFGTFCERQYGDYSACRFRPHAEMQNLIRTTPRKLKNSP